MARSLTGGSTTIIEASTTALPSKAARDHCCFSVFAADENDAEKGMVLASTSKSEYDFPSKQKEEEDVIPGTISRCDYEENENEKEIRILSGVTLSSEESKAGIVGSSITSICTPVTTDNVTTKAKTSEAPSLTNNAHKRFIYRNYETFPHGTPRLAAFQSSYDSLAIWRRFSRSHCRILQRMQNRITRLEQQLDELDEKDAGTTMKYRLARNDWKEGWDRTQEDLQDELQKRLVEYDDFLLKDNQLRRLAPAASRNHLHLFNWIYNTKPLDKNHWDFILYPNDFVSLSDKGDRLDHWIEICLSRWPALRFWYFRDRTEKIQDPRVHFFSQTRIALVAKLIALCTSLAILLIPIFLFSLVNLSRKITLIVVLIFVLLFAIALSLFCEAGVYSIFIGTCTYAAVLVTFLGNVQSNWAS